MSLFSRINTWLSKDGIDPASLNGEFNNVINPLNSLNDGSLNWTNVKATNLIGTNSTLGTLTANLAAGGFKLTGLAAGTTNGDSLRYEQLAGSYLPLSGGTLTGNLSFDNYSTHGLAGTATNDNAAAGNIGERIVATVGSSSGVSSTGTNNTFTVTSISLTAGDWDVSAVWSIVYTGATITYHDLTVDTSNTGASAVYGDTRLEVRPPVTSASGIDNSYTLPGVRMSLSGTTTIYLLARIGFSVATPKVYGRLSARRVR